MSLNSCTRTFGLSVIINIWFKIEISLRTTRGRAWRPTVSQPRCVITAGRRRKLAA